MATFRNPSFQRIVERTLKQAASALRDADVEFCLVGSLSAWVRGGPESSHDLDFGVRAEDIVKAAHALERIGMIIEVPPEDWLVKAWDGEPNQVDSNAVDLIYAPSGVPITTEVLARADEMDVLAHTMRVLNPADLMIMKLLSLREQNLNLTSSIATARSIREQINWKWVREACADSPYARGFFIMAEGLGIIPPEAEHGGEAENEIMTSMQSQQRPADQAQVYRRELMDYIKGRD